MKDKDARKLWFEGPPFLSLPLSEWPVDKGEYLAVSEDDDEVKKERMTLHVNSEERQDVMDDLTARYSDWYRLRRAVVWLNKFTKYCRFKFGKAENPPSSCITVDDLQKSEKLIIHNAQKDLRVALQKRAPNSLRQLSPYLDEEEGLVKVGGRLRRSGLSDESCHQIILPSRHQVTALIIQYFHQRVGHAGSARVLAETRQRYWIVKGHSAVKRVLQECFMCRRRNAPLANQLMADLPKERLEPDKAPFSYCGIDYFGPFNVKQGRSAVKRYGCIFTCFTTRAVHIEVAHALDTNSFLAAFLRFTSRRGMPIKVFSDNGTNFHGGENELKQQLNAWNQQQIENSMLRQEIAWHFNPPKASNYGGIWERLIRSIRKILTSIVSQQLLSDEALVTVLAEVEKILNDRPLTFVSDDPRDPEILTPNKLLLLKPNRCLPLGVFDEKDQYARRWWRQACYLASVFWRRWLKEYVPTLQVRQKWLTAQRNFQVNDIVLISDENLKRGDWPLGLVTETFPDENGHVRTVRLRVGGTSKVRPINKLCFLEAYA